MVFLIGQALACLEIGPADARWKGLEVLERNLGPVSGIDARDNATVIRCAIA